MNKHIFAAAAIALVPFFAASPAFAQDTAPAGTYVEDDGHAYVTFSYDHQGYSAPQVRFNDFAIELGYDPENVEASTIAATIEVASIDTGVEKLDNHLKSADFFEVETWPRITFTSTELTQLTPTTGTMTGDLTIKGVTKPVTLDVTLNKVGAGRDGTPKMGISARGMFLRSDYGVDFLVPMVGDEVNVVIELEMVKQAQP